LVADNFLDLLGRLHIPSLLIGICLTAVSMLSFLLFIYNRAQRAQRDRLQLSMRLEQAGQAAQRGEDEAERLRNERDTLRQQKEELQRDNIGLEAFLHETRAVAGERQQLLEQGKQQMEEDFYNLSRKVMAEQGRVLSEQHAGGLENLLLPVQNQLDAFRKKVEDVYDRESRDRLSLVKEIEHLKTLNERISREAVDLTRALQGTNKLQGQWGEMVLERLLEESGLRPGSEFATQVSLRDEKGKLKQPDVIVYLPENRAVIIDAKMSLNSYVEAGRTDDVKERERHLKNHISSIQKHVSGLSNKQYQLLPDLTTLDFVLLFIPVEGAFQAAVSKKPELLSESMRRRVIIASPSTLLAILRTVHHIWRIDEQNRNGLLIAKEAGKLYDKLVGFVEAFAEVGNRLEQARQSWQLAEKRLSTGKGNLIDRAESLKELGVQPSKELPREK
jgi:DNA recombination protein RmuC